MIKFKCDKNFLLLILALLLLIPSLFTAFYLDDWIFYRLLEGGGPEPVDKWNIYTLIPHNPERTQQWIENGHYPWWTYLDLKIDFFRPLSSLLLYFDYVLFGKQAFIPHVQSLIWLGMLLWCYQWIYRRYLPRNVALLAFLFCVLSNSHTFASAWLSNRNALVATVPVFLGLIAHIKWREDKWKAGLPLSVLGYTTGLLGGEMALSALAYLFSYEIWGGLKGKCYKSKLKGLSGGIVVLIAYVILYIVLEKGASHSGFYINPIQDSTAFIWNGIGRLFALLGDQILGVMSDLWFLSIGMRVALVVIGIIAVLLLTYFAKNCWRQAPLWLLMGALFSLIPVVSAMPSTRQLLCTSLGAFAFIAILIHYAWENRKKEKLLFIFSLYLIGVHAFISPLLLLYTQSTFSATENKAREIADDLNQNKINSGFKDIVLMSAPDHIIGIYVPSICYYFDEVKFKSWRILSMAPYDHHVKRVADDALEITLPGGKWMQSPIEEIWRSQNYLFKEGDEIVLNDLTIKIEELKDSFPSRISYRFKRSLDDPQFIFVKWDGVKLIPFEMPEIGNSEILRKYPGPSGL